MSYRLKIIVVTASILILTLLFLSLRHAPIFTTWAKDQYFGEVVTVSASQLTISDKKNSQIEIEINQETSVFKGRVQVSTDELTVKTVVLVIGKRNEQGVIKAEVIRVFPPRKK